MQEKRNSLVLGGGLILVGLYLLARSLGVALPGWNAVWPLALLVAGISSLVQALGQDPRDSGGVWFGVTAMLCSSVFLYITMGRGDWSDMTSLWPAFPAAAALGWLCAWLVRPREVSSLVMAGIAGAGAVLGYAFTVGRLNAESGRQLASWWPLVLVALGVGYIVQYLLQKR